MKKKHQKGKINKKYELFDALCQEMEERTIVCRIRPFRQKKLGHRNAAANSIYRIGRDWLFLALGSGCIAIMGD